MRLKTSSSENRKQPSRLRSSVLVVRAARLVQIVEHAGVGVEFLVLILREVVDLNVVAQAVFAARERLDAGQQFDERRLAGAVHAHQGDAVAALDDEVHAAEDEFLAVALGDVLKLGHDAAARLGLGKRKMDGLLFGRQLDALDLVELLDPALHLLGFGGLVAEAVDERLQLLDALALIVVGGFELVACAPVSAAGTFRSCRE